MFMAMPTVLFPALAKDVLQRPELLGLLYTAGTVGALAASLTSGWTGRTHHHGRAVVIAAMAWGASVALAGLLQNPWLVLLCFAVAGAADNISGDLPQHHLAPDDPRLDARPARRDRDAVLLRRPDRRGDPLRARRRPVRGATGDHQRRHPLRARGRRHPVWLRGFWTYDDRTDPYAVHERTVRAQRAQQG